MLRTVLAATAAFGALLIAVTPGRAIDCAKARGGVDRTICSDQALRAADTAMNTAYAAILKAAGDADIRAALVASQRRWVARRNEDLGHLDQEQDAPDAAARRAIVLKAIDDRTRNLGRRASSDPQTFRLIARLRDQRAYLARFSGGPFAGFDTSCVFLPGGDGRVYGCFGRQRYQNGDRVCTLDQEWASGSVSETRTAGRVIGGTLHDVATCSIGGGDGPACPDSATAASRAAHWGKASGVEHVPSSPLPRLDADAYVDTDATWLPACLGRAAGQAGGRPS